MNKHVSRIKFMAIAAVIAAITIVAGCASAPLRTEEASTSGIRAAEEAGAAKVPQASLHLQLAKEENEHAQKFIKEGDAPHAEGQLMRAQADAELALALAREAPMQVEAQQEADKARSLQQQSNH
jgi:outer membrane murein-binding lipoprotein Lpp